jgi:hypothetical protein
MKMNFFKTCKFAVGTLLFSSFLFFSCATDADNVTPTVGKKAEMPEFTTDYDKQINDLAQAVGKAVQNNDGFRGLIRDRAMQQFDGDYDVLMTQITDVTIPISDKNIATRSASSELSVRDLLQSYYSQNTTRAIPTESVIDEMERLYPALQISVPIHAEEWDPAIQAPTIVFIPEGYEEGTTTVVPGYDSNGDFVWVDAINEPDYPVIVIGMNERVDDDGELLKLDDIPMIYPFGDKNWDDSPSGEVTTPSAPTNLTGTVANNGIYLSWGHSETPEMYYIYRKAYNGASYTKYATVTGSYNRSYTDYSVTSGRSYSYYVTAVNRDSYTVKESAPSNYVLANAPAVPAALSNFAATLSGKNVELNWNNDGDNLSSVKIEYAVPENSSYYNMLTTLNGGINYFIHNNTNKGKMTRYRASRTNANGTSDAKTDFIYVPYRNSAANSPVYIKQITYTDGSAEGWIAGKPEFYLKIVGSTNDGKTVELQKDMDFKFNKRSKSSQIFTDRHAYNWRYYTDRDWYSTMTFYLEEYDRPSGEYKFIANAKLNAKLSDNLGAEAGVGLEVAFKNKGNWCGSSYTNYFDNPEMWLTFPGYGAKVLISEKP